MQYRPCTHSPQRRRALTQAATALGAAVLPARLRAAAGPATAPVTAPVTAPAIELLTNQGDAVLAPGGPWRATYLDFWASWCLPCKLSFPWMNEMQARHGAAGLRIVAINLDRNAADAQRFLQAHPATFALAMDPGATTARRYDIAAMPTSLLVGADLQVRFSHKGFRLEDRALLEQRIVAALT